MCVGLRLFPFPLGVRDWLRLMILALPGLFFLPSFKVRFCSKGKATRTLISSPIPVFAFADHSKPISLLQFFFACMLVISSLLSLLANVCYSSFLCLVRRKGYVFLLWASLVTSFIRLCFTFCFNLIKYHNDLILSVLL